MTLKARAAKTANSVWLMLISRLSMAAMPLLLGTLVTVGWAYLDGRFEAVGAQATAAASTADDANDAVNALTVRVTAVETTITEGRKRRDDQFETLTGMIAGLTAQITALQRDLTTALQAVAGLQATVNILRPPGTPGPPPTSLIAP